MALIPEKGQEISCLRLRERWLHVLFPVGIKRRILCCLMLCRGDELLPPAAVLPALARRLCGASPAVLGSWAVVTLTTTAEDLISRKQFGGTD